jgi:DNA polymerase-4
MPVSVPPCVVHLDLDAFFASVEQRDDPRLQGVPVAVGSGVAASCSYEARRWGVRTGMRLSDARRLCPSLRVLPGDYRRYEQAGRRTLAICLERAIAVESMALDDLYLDLGPCLQKTVAIARELGEQIRGEVGLGVSGGVGRGKLIARVATQEAKRRKLEAMKRTTRGLVSPLTLPAEVVLVPPGAEREYLAPWPVRMLPGLGHRAGARLERLNVRTVGEVATMPPAVLCGLFGRRGRLLREMARGVDLRPLQPSRPPRSVSRRTSFEPPASEWSFVLGMLDHLLERATAWLRLRGLAARGLALVLQYGDYRTAEGRISAARPTADESWWKEAARDRLLRLYIRRLPLRLLGVTFAPLQTASQQGELFPDPAAQRRRRLEECKDAVRGRFGFMALMPGTSLVLAESLEHDRDNFRLRTSCLTR